MAGVEIRAVEKRYPNGYKAIHGIDLDIVDGEFVVLVGPSGCGKSTLLRMVAGLEAVTAGEIHIAGRRVNDVEPADRDIAMVFQNYALYPHMSCYANMAYGLRNKGTPKDEIERRVREAARILELDELLERKPRQLSGGQRQRVAMGRAIVREPAVFLFDEPLSNLDAKLRVQMRVEIKKLQRSIGTTSIYVTHDQVEAMTMADRLVVMNAGVAEQIGTPLEVYQRPVTRFVAGFIGSPSMNFLAASVGGAGDSVELAGGERIALGREALTRLAGREMTLGVRPEHLAIVSDAESVARLTVDLVEPLGADTLVHGHFGADATDLTIRVNGTGSFAVGERLPIHIGVDRMHFFDSDSGLRLQA
jgi:sn-glycerol 3-phosphate transport system ATP-binding protein